MHNKAQITLEFDKIKERLGEHALTGEACRQLATLEPYLKEDQCKQKMAETTSARKLLDSLGTPPIPSMKGLEEILTLCEAGSMLTPEQLTSVAQFAISCRRLKAYLKRGEGVDELIAPYGGSLAGLEELQEEIERCVRGEFIEDSASSALGSIRRKMEQTEAQIKEKLNHILRSKKQWLSDGYISTKNGRYVVPVKKEYRNQFPGTVVEMSGSGGTLFMEPEAVSRLQSALSLLSIEEDNEVRKILYTLTGLVGGFAPDIRRSMEGIVILDTVFAKGKLSAGMGAVPVAVGTRREIRIHKGRHPLLDQKSCVPLDFQVGGDIRGVVITGPNTGGKTVALKTVGLLSMMAQCGLHIPAEPDSYIAMHSGYWCDIGDGQSISENLSTFSGHMTHIIEILNRADRDSLVLLDELGSGTDPAEGMGIAIAVLEELRRRECLFLVTTHYPQVKDYAETTPVIRSARMAFDRETLSPLYRLELGKVGESCALYIAQRLGFPAHLLERAYREAYRETPEAPRHNPPPELDILPSGERSQETPKSKLQKSAEPRPISTHAQKFQMGDSVVVYPEKETGIVFQPADSQGKIGVQIKGRKTLVNHKRVKLRVAAAELYPPDYDFSILFDSVENRKARHKMGKGHQPGLETREEVIEE